MSTATLEERYAANLHGALSCFDRIIITGTLPGACYAEGMTSHLYAHGIRVFDYPRFAEPLRERIRERAQVLANAFSPDVLHRRLDHYAQWLCPVLDVFGQCYHWSIRHLNITPSAMSRQLKRLHHLLGLIKKVSHTYRYYLTRMVRAAIAAACSLTRFNIVPTMAATH